MGTGRSKEYTDAATRSNKIDRVVKNYFVMDQKVIKLLLLGAGESGKSTIFKQMKYLYGNPYPPAERQQFKPVIHENILANMTLLLHQVPDFPLKSKFLLAVPVAENSIVTPELADLLVQLWNSPSVQLAWKNRSRFQIQDALQYYMSDIHRIAHADYLPTVDDIFRTRVRTSGIVETSLHIDKVEFVLYDVGGQRNERKKWMYCFDQVTAVIFVLAVNEFDQFLYEDEKMSRMDESLMLFDETCNLKFFAKTSMILFLNKSDLFREKLKTTPIRIDDGPDKRYVDFKGPFVVGDSVSPHEFEKGYEAGLQYFLTLFLNRNHHPEKEIFHHVTCATDSDNVRVVFSACKHIILSNHLTSSGFLGL